MAQATNCPSPDLPIGYPYCEYRDYPGTNSTRGTAETNGVGSRGREDFTFTFEDVDGGLYGYRLENLMLYLGGSAYRNTANRARLDAGRSWGPTFDISGIPNYTKGGSATGKIVLTKDGTDMESCTINIIDDDNSAYVGQRRQHPYGGTWKSTPHCFTQGCAWD